LGSNEWVAGFAYYEVLVSFCVRG